MATVASQNTINLPNAFGILRKLTDISFDINFRVLSKYNFQRMQYSRRTFLQQTTLAAAGMLTASCNILPKSAKAGNLEPGIILNTVKVAMEEDYAGTLEKLAGMGYRYVEGGAYGDSLEDYAALLKDLGLGAIAGGSGLSDLQKNLDKYLRRGEALGYRYIPCYWPWLSSAQNLTRDECRQAADNLNEVGKRAKAAGFRLIWHNHDKEFVDLGGVMPFDLLMEYTDPDLVGVQLDTYWVAKGNQDPVAMLKKYPGRYDMLHLKDMDRTTERGMTCVGEGLLDFKEIFAQLETAGMRHATVEQEQAGEDGLRCAEASIRNLLALGVY